MVVEHFRFFLKFTTQITKPMIKTITLAIAILALSINVLSQEYNAIVTRNYETYNVKEGSLSNQVEMTLQINNKEGDKYAHFYIPYSKNMPLTDLEAHIELPGGTIVRELKNKQIVSKSAISNSSLYEDDFVKDFTLQHNVYPYIIKLKYSYTLRDFPDIAQWHPYYDTDIPVTDARLIISTPTKLKLQISNPSAIKDSVTLFEETTTHCWKTSYTPTKEEVFSPSSESLIPKIIVTTPNFHWQLDGNCETWQNLGLWQYNINKGRDYLPPMEKLKVHELTDKLSSRQDKINTLYQYLQKTKRYINVSINYGGLQTMPAEYVCTNGYGDCKALSNYIVALLKEAGIKSYYAKVRAGEENEPIETSIPSLQFNHIIVCVPLDKDSCWLDCTSQYNPAGYLGSFTQDRYALLIDETGGQLVRTPALTDKDCIFERTTRVDAQNQKATICMNLYGPYFEDFNSLDKNNPASYHEYILDKYLFSSLDVKECTFNPSKNKALTSLVVKGDLPIANIGTGNSMIYSPPGLNIPKLEKPATRTLPVSIQLPEIIRDTTIVEFKNSYHSITNKSQQRIESPYGSYEKQIALNNNQLIIVKNYHLKKGYYNLKEYAAFYEFIQSVRKADAEKIILIP